MGRILLRWLGLALVASSGTVLGLAGAALGTDVGRRLIVTAALSIANDALNGTVAVDSVDGSLYEGLVAHGVRLVGDDQRPLAEIDRLQLRYRLGDLLSRRIVLGQLALRGARISLERRPGERFNFEDVLGLGGEGDGGPGPLVAFRNVRVTDLEIAVRTPAGPDSSQVRERRFVVPGARFAYVRVSSPLPGESGVLFEVGALAAEASDPRLTVRDAEGRVEIRGDTLRFDLGRVQLPGTRSTFRGRMWDLSQGPLVDLAFEAAEFRAEDLRALFDWLPAGLSGRGAIEARFESADVLRVQARNLRLAAADGGTLRGTLGFVIGPGEEWATDGLDVQTRDFDLANLRGLLDTVPVDGRLTGRTRANGPRRGMQVGLQWVFHDRRADSAATSLAGSGEVAFGVPGDVVFLGLTLDSAHIPLATVRAISPGIELLGWLDLAGTLDGEWRNATFTGRMAHRHEALPVSRARGTVRLDLRGPTAGVWAGLAFDSLQFAGLRPSYPQVPFVGAMVGDLRLAGTLDQLAFDGDLRGRAGRLMGTGTFILDAPRLGVRDLDLQYRNLTLEAIEARVRRTALNGRVRGTVETNPPSAPVVDVALELDRSLLGGSAIDSARARLTVRDSVVRVDTVRAWVRGVVLAGRGGLGLGASRRDSLVLDLDIDSIAALAPLLLQLAGRDTATLAADTLQGSADGRVTLAGALDRLELGWTLRGPRVEWNDLGISGLRTSGRWGGADARVAIRLEIDTIESGPRRFHRVIAGAAGRSDSLRWLGRAGIGGHAAVRSGGSLVRRSPSVLAIDSLVLDTADDEWRLGRDASLTVTDSTVTLQGLVLTAAAGRSRVAVGGVVPRLGPGAFEGSIEALPLRDVWAVLQLDPDATAGEVSGTFRVGGRAREPIIDAAFSMQNAVFNEFRAPLTDGTIRYRDRRLTGALTMWRSGVQVLGIELELPIDLGFRDVRTRRLPGGIAVRGRADGVDLALLSATTPLVRQTEGRLWADLAITGTWERPQLTGSVEVRDGAATFPALGVRHRQLHGRLSLSGDTIRVDTLSVWSGGGSAAVRGVVRLIELTQPVLDLAVTAQDFRAIEVPGFLTLTTSGRVRLQGPVVGALLTGSGTIPRGVLHFADIVEKNIVDLEDTLALDSATAALIREQRLGPDFEIRFLDSLRVENLVLEMGNDVRLRSSEADIQLTGQVQVGKIGDRYRVDGTLRTPRGTYQLYLGPTIRKPFTVTRGEVRYFGTPDLNAALDIDARHQLRGVRGDNVTVFVNVGGTILQPQLRLSSDVQPPLSETEIISYLVFGAPSAQAASGEVGRYGLQQSISTLTGQITGQLGSALISDLGVPLDFFEIRPQFGARGVEATDIAVGRQIGDRWFLTLSPRVCRKQAFSVENVGGSLEFRIGEGWSLLASADPVRVCNLSGSAGFGTQVQLGIDVLWERRF